MLTTNKQVIQIINLWMNENYYLIKKINRLIGKIQREGFTIIPTKMYFKKGKAKLNLPSPKEKNNTTKDLQRKLGIGIVIIKYYKKI